MLFMHQREQHKRGIYIYITVLKYDSTTKEFKCCLCGFLVVGDIFINLDSQHSDNLSLIMHNHSITHGLYSW